MKKLKLLTALAALILILSLASCATFGTEQESSEPSGIEILGTEIVELGLGESFTPKLSVPDTDSIYLTWTSVGDAISVSPDGVVTAHAIGEGTVRVIYTKGGVFSDEITVRVIKKVDATPDDTPVDELPTSDPYVNVSRSEFYEDYSPATNYLDAYYRSQHGFLSGSITLPGKEQTTAQNRPTQDGMYVKNTEMRYADNGNTYIVCDSNGVEVMRIYKDGAYITLEEVAAYIYAFGGSSSSIPKNYDPDKDASPSGSIWGKYLRVNHSYFSGDTEKYPYEPELPNIRGCGGKLSYYEMDIGTSGYNTGYKIARGTCRIVYGRADLNGNGKWDEGEIYVFYTNNHYNDFTEYLNYYNGWGKTFGNITGGGKYNSKTNCNPTPYVPTYTASLVAPAETIVVYFDFKRLALYA